MTSDTKLPRRRLGASGLQAGAVGLGCMGMTWAYNAHERDDDDIGRGSSTARSTSAWT